MKDGKDIKIGDKVHVKIIDDISAGGDGSVMFDGAATVAKILPMDGKQTFYFNETDLIAYEHEIITILNP